VFRPEVLGEFVTFSKVSARGLAAGTGTFLTSTTLLQPNLCNAGVDTVTVMKLYGWKSVAMFLRYNEVDANDLQKASLGIA